MKKGFTLIEILGVIVILGVLALITIPVIDNVLRESREKAYNQNVEYILGAALKYSFNLDYSTTESTLELQTLKNAGLLKDEDIRNPIDGTLMTGCVRYTWVESTNQYSMRYEEDLSQCD